MKTLIITVTIVALSAVVGSIIVGGIVFDGVVVEKPYEKGLQWDKAQNEKAESGWSVVTENKLFRTGDNEILFEVLDRDRKQLSEAQVAVMISRPSTTAYDKSFETSASGDSRYKASINFPLFGYWDIRIGVSSDKRNVVFEERVYVEKSLVVQHEHKHAIAETDCYIDRGPCVKTLAGRNIEISFDINPKPVRPMTDLVFTVILKEPDNPVSDADIALDLSMPGMFMGLNRPVIKHVKDGRYEGKGVIPTCPHGGKIWKADVTVKRDNESVNVNYIFEVKQ